MAIAFNGNIIQTLFEMLPESVQQELRRLIGAAADMLAIGLIVVAAVMANLA